MKNKGRQLLISLSLSVLLLVGCAESSHEREPIDNEEAYETAMQNGLDELQLDRLEEAETYFETALEEKEEDEQATILLAQTQNYAEAIHLFEEEAHEEALEKADAVQTVENGSSYLAQQANQLHTDIRGRLAEEKETETQAKTEEEKFEEFQGVFALFSGTPYESPIDYAFLFNGETIVDGFSQSDYVISEVTDRYFEGDTLIMDIHTPAQPGYGESTHQLVMTLAYDQNDNKYIEFDTGAQLYQITMEDLVKGGFQKPEISEQFINELKTYDENVS